MKKTVGMITIYRKNYGAFLQAYALQQVLIAQGFQPEIIRYDYYRDHTILGINLDNIKFPVRFAKMLAVEIVRNNAHRNREKLFKVSIEKYIFEAKQYYKNYRQLEKNPPKYDIYITGSDQVFNPDISPQALKARLLCFAQEGVKMSYAASAGRTELPRKDIPFFKEALKTFSFVSVRESGLQESLERDLGIKATRNIDPTLLLTKEKWESFGQDMLEVTEDYIFYYRVLPQQALKEKAQQLSEKLGLPIFVAEGNESFPNQIPRTRDLSPEEWVGMMARAKYVVTNSFHGSAFAINLEKRASIVTAPSGGARITDLLKKCNLTEIMELEVMPEDTERIYADARQYLQQERKSAFDLFQQLEMTLES